MKILNLYAGIGGNRKLWGYEHEITAVEINQSIADVYKLNFPNDKVIVADAHQYLLDHYQEYDFIWSSPPCPTHSRMRKTNVGKGERKTPLTYPDMRLYQEIIVLQHFFKGTWVVENVIPYYKSLIVPTVIINRHTFWSNKIINHTKNIKSDFSINKSKRNIDINFGNVKLTHRKDQVIRNMVEPELGLYILKEVLK